MSYKVGIISPGFIGVQLAHSLVHNRQKVMYASEGRSEGTIKHAKMLQLEDVGSISEMGKVADIIVSVAPYEEIFKISQAVIDSGFKGLFVDFNWIRGDEWEEYRNILLKSGISYIDAAVFSDSKLGDDIYEKFVLIESGTEHEEVLLELFQENREATYVPKIIDMNPKDYKNLHENESTGHVSVLSSGESQAPLLPDLHLEASPVPPSRGQGTKHSGQKPDSSITIGILSPGRMGATIGYALRHHKVVYASKGRFDENDCAYPEGSHSPITIHRAERIEATDVETIEKLVEVSDVIISITAGTAVHKNATVVSSYGFDGIFVDANSISCNIADNFNTDLLDIVNDGVMKYVEGAIFGYPADVMGERLFFLNGEHAQTVADLFKVDENEIFTMVVLEESSKEYKAKKVEEQNES